MGFTGIDVAEDQNSHDSEGSLRMKRRYMMNVIRESKAIPTPNITAMAVRVGTNTPVL